MPEGARMRVQIPVLISMLVGVWLIKKKKLTFEDVLVVEIQRYFPFTSKQIKTRHVDEGAIERRLVS